jgi:hypothetical protein
MDILDALPPFVSSQVVQYMTPEWFGDLTHVTFEKICPEAHLDWRDSNYGSRFELGKDTHGNVLSHTISKSYELNQVKKVHLSRIPKKNGRHRYYLTFADMYQECSSCGNMMCNNLYCRGRMEYNAYVSSKYIGTNLDSALATFLMYDPSPPHLESFE